MDKDGTKDFFISYTQADREWAEWIAWQLEAEGYTTVIQAWDFLPGSNFVLDMDRASGQAHRTIAVLSPDYLTSNFTPAEWAAAFAQDPTSQQGKLLPIRVRACTLSGLLAQLVYLDLVDLDEQRAAVTLRAGVTQGRARPSTAPRYPGSKAPAASQPSPFPGPRVLPRAWTVPFRHNPFFTGREPVFTQVHELLHAGSARPRQQWSMRIASEMTISLCCGYRPIPRKRCSQTSSHWPRRSACLNTMSRSSWWWYTR